MIPIPFSEKMMAKFGPTVHQSLTDLSMVRKFIYWCIDSKYRRCVYLNQWLKKQVTENMPDVLFMPINDLYGNSDDTTVINVLRWVRRFLTYKPDSINWDMSEYWQTLAETYTHESGDCEDGAILIYCICRHLGIPANKLFIACGDVIVPNGLAGHAYVIYRSDKDGLEYPIDWCYNYNGSYIAQNRSPFAYNMDYEEPWFKFNEDAAYMNRKR